MKNLDLSESAYPSLLRFKDKTVADDKLILGGKLLALCVTTCVFICSLDKFGDINQMDKVTHFY
jgi:hypothetical protein